MRWSMIISRRAELTGKPLSHQLNNGRAWNLVECKHSISETGSEASGGGAWKDAQPTSPLDGAIVKCTSWTTRDRLIVFVWLNRMGAELKPLEFAIAKTRFWNRKYVRIKRRTNPLTLHPLDPNTHRQPVRTQKQQKASVCQPIAFEVYKTIEPKFWFRFSSPIDTHYQPENQTDELVGGSTCWMHVKVQLANAEQRLAKRLSENASMLPDSSYPCNLQTLSEEKEICIRILPA